MQRFTGVLGILAVLLAAWLFSTDRRKIRWRTVAWGLSLQLLFAFFVLRFDFGQRAMFWAGGVVTKMLSATVAGTSVLFGKLGTPDTSLGSIFAFQVLPTIIFISAFFAVMYHIAFNTELNENRWIVGPENVGEFRAEADALAAQDKNNLPMFYSTLPSAFRRNSFLPRQKILC